MPVTEWNEGAIECYVVSKVQLLYLVAKAFYVELWHSHTEVCTLATRNVRLLHFYQDVCGMVRKAERVVIIQIDSDYVAVPAYIFTKILHLECAECLSWIGSKCFIATVLSVRAPSNSWYVLCKINRKLVRILVIISTYCVNAPWNQREQMCKCSTRQKWPLQYRANICGSKWCRNCQSSWLWLCPQGNWGQTCLTVWHHWGTWHTCAQPASSDRRGTASSAYSEVQRRECRALPAGSPTNWFRTPQSSRRRRHSAGILPFEI